MRRSIKNDLWASAHKRCFTRIPILANFKTNDRHERMVWLFTLTIGDALRREDEETGRER